MNTTFGVPFGARTGAGHAGVDSSAVRPITPGKAVPDGYSFSGISTLLGRVIGAPSISVAGRPAHHPHRMIRESIPDLGAAPAQDESRQHSRYRDRLGVRCRIEARAVARPDDQPRSRMGRRLSLKGVGSGRRGRRRWVRRCDRVRRGERCDCVGRVSGRHGGELVAVNLGEVVGHHQQSPLEADFGPAAPVEPVDAAVVLGVAEQRLDGLFALSIALMAVL